MGESKRLGTITLTCETDQEAKRVFKMLKRYMRRQKKNGGSFELLDITVENIPRTLERLRKRGKSVVEGVGLEELIRQHEAKKEAEAAYFDEMPQESGETE